MDQVEADRLFRAARAGDGQEVWVSFTLDDVERVGVLRSAGPTTARVRAWPSGDQWDAPLETVHHVDRPEAAAAGMTIETMTAALTGRRHPWVRWDDGGVAHRGIVEGFVPDDVGVVKVREDSPANLSQRIMVGRLTLESNDRSLPAMFERAGEWTAERALDVVRAGHVLDRDSVRGGWVVIMSGAVGDSHPARPQYADRELRDVLDVLADEQMIAPAMNGKPWRETQESDRLPFITNPTAPMGFGDRRWVSPDALDAVAVERDQAIADATRMRRLLWLVLRGVALSEAQAAAWLELLLEEPPTG